MPDENTRKYYFPDWSDNCALFIAKSKANDIKILSNIINTDTCIFEHVSLMDCWLLTNIQKVYNL